MKAKRVSREEQLKLIMECRSSGLSDYQWCEVIIPGLSEPPVRTLRATVPENESHIFR